MGQRYGQLSLEERCEIARLQGAGCSRRAIAKALGRDPSTIGRELKRNTDRDAGYKPAKAQSKADQRCWKGARLDRNDALREEVLGLLGQGWSPEQAAGWLSAKAGARILSHETIYRFIYAQLKRTHDGSWRRYLPRAKSRRGRRGKKGGSPASFIKDRISIDNRPLDAGDRKQPGHWEADFMLFSRYGQNLLVLHERASRFTALVKTDNRQAEPTAKLLASLLSPLPKELRRTLTFDNGTEFAEHHRLNQDPGLATYFCDPHAPWQKGGVENAIGRIRRFLPRRSDLETIDPADIFRSALAYNHIPRKCLDFQTPAEVLSQVLHFKRDSTSPLSRG